jgi:hypothetical protein
VTESTVTLPPELQGVAIMPSYRVYFIDRTNHTTRPSEVIECTNDQEAAQMGKQLADGGDMELWHGARFVMRLPHRENKPSQKTALRRPWRDVPMSEDMEFQFRGGNPKKWHSGKIRLEGRLVTATAPDGRTKSAQSGGSNHEAVARLLLLELEREKSE